MTATRNQWVAAALGAAALAPIAVKQAVNRLAPPEGAPGEFVEFDGERVHALVNREGDGPTVVFESGLSCPCTEWAWVLRGIDGRFPYVVYDRPGNGWSPARGRRGAAKTNDVTAGLLAALGLPAPYVFVGHSVGGLVARAFAAGRPDQVAGLVLAESSHPDQGSRVPAQREALLMVRHNISNLRLRSFFGVDVGPEPMRYFRALPPELVACTVHAVSSAAVWRGAAMEFDVWESRWAKEVRDKPLPGDLPVAVLTAGVNADPQHLVLQRELAELSDVHRHTVVDGADHNGLVMHREPAAEIVGAIEWAATARVPVLEPLNRPR
ncbi:alpha/beta hydrolase [Amycolatopsis minnesotensis]|uniref:AB hydrolase-1 domain-containing protein n=1 Tax=Amycolatopsis minnesotensis TaxID=337894 RepID=A0ABP5D5T1_9PSEU